MICINWCRIHNIFSFILLDNMSENIRSSFQSITDDLENIKIKFEIMSDDTQGYFCRDACYIIKRLEQDIHLVNNIISGYYTDPVKEKRFSDESDKINEIIKKLFIPYYLIANNLELSRTNQANECDDIN